MWHDDEIALDHSCPGCIDGCSDCEPGEGRAAFNAKYGYLLADPKAKERYLAEKAGEAVPEAVDEEDETLPISGFCRDCQRSFPTLREANRHVCEGRAVG